MPAQFNISEVEDNEEGWGPTSIPDHLAGVPYAPYGKAEKVGKISDFTQAAGKYGGTRKDDEVVVHTTLECQFGDFCSK